jgi:hypothetical protein
LNGEVVMGSCEGKERIIELVYGEISASASADLKAHAAVCSECTTELSSLSLVRAEVTAFKSSAFDTLATPFIDLSVFSVEREPRNSFAGLVDLLRGSFGLRLSFAGLMIAMTAGVAAFLILGSGNDVQLAINAVAPPEIAANIEPTTDPQPKAPETRSSDEGKVVESAASPTVASESRRAAPKASKARTEAVQRKQSAITTETAGFDEFADDSLRLSDMLEQIGG